MTSTSRKSLSTWVTCQTCQATVTQKDMPGHTSECPPTFDTWKHSFILNDVLYTNPVIYKPQEQPKNLAEHELNDLVFLSNSVLQKCGIAISDPVVIATQEKVIVKKAWPMSENTLTSVCLTKASMELNNIQGPVKVLRLKDEVFIAEEMRIVPVGKHALSEKSADLAMILKNYNEDKIFCVGNKISIPFYGRKLIYEILGCKLKKSEGCEPQCASDENLIEMLKKVDLTECCPKLGPFNKALFSTNWVILRPEDVNNVQKKKRIFTINDIGGYDDLIEDIKDVIDIALGKCQNIGEFCITKGVLLYGTPGVGKSMIASALISLYDAATFTVHSSDIYSKTLGVSEERLKDIFNEAKANSPSIILIEDIDTLCPKRSNTSTDNERRVLTTLVALFDDLQNTAENVLVLATTSKIQFIDPSVRRPGRIDKEFEIFVPAPHMRTQILLKLLSKVPHTLTDKDVSSISFVTHGFVAADLYGLCSQAVMSAIKRQQKLNIPPEKSMVTMDDFNCALKITKPSAMKEVLVEVPDVRWSDIGGQADLKLKLKQAVEWPLRHPEAFVRMGITPPRGVLMFGPPGCSKTMIAKALATESKLNFLNIKGPELFSKWVGESEKAVREVFRKARQVAPSIIFIDEIDALGGERSSSSGSGSNVQERVLAQLLTELDGVTALGDVTLVAATNRPDKIDKALLRPGRLDRIIYVPLPDDVTRQEIFDIKLRNMPIAEDVNTNDLVDLTEGYSGAEIQAICHEAAMKALEEDLDAAVVTKEHFRAALSVVTPRTPAALVKLYDDYMNKVY